MHDGDRTERTADWLALSVALNIAAVIVLGGFWLDSASQKPSEEIERYEARCADAESRYRAFLRKFPESVSADDERGNGKREKQYREQYTAWCDLVSQQTSAEAAVVAAKETKRVTALTILGVFLLWWTLNLTRTALRVTQQATRTTNEIGDAQIRAYLSIEAKSAGFKAKKLREGLWALECTISFKIRNQGITPPVRTEIEYTARVSHKVGEFRNSSLGRHKYFTFPTGPMPPSFGGKIKEEIEISLDEIGRECTAVVSGAIKHTDSFLGKWWIIAGIGGQEVPFEMRFSIDRLITNIRSNPQASSHTLEWHPDTEEQP